MKAEEQLYSERAERSNATLRAGAATTNAFMLMPKTANNGFPEG